LYRTFHVFKIFVANPSKTPEIESILCKNRTKLIAYLEVFHTENEDPQFVDEKRLLIE
jgi:calcium binding protein 39